MQEPWGFFLLVCPVSFGLGSHRSSDLATSVPLEEWEYNHIGKCSLFVQPYVSKVILGTLD